MKSQRISIGVLRLEEMPSAVTHKFNGVVHVKGRQYPYTYEVTWTPDQIEHYVHWSELPAENWEVLEDEIVKAHEKAVWGLI